MWTSQDSSSCYLPAWLAWWVAFKLMVATWLLHLQSSFQAGRRGSLKDKTAKLSPCDIWLYIFEEKSFPGTSTNPPLAPSHPAQDGHMIWGGWQIKFLVFQTLWRRWQEKADWSGYWESQPRYLSLDGLKLKNHGKFSEPWEFEAHNSSYVLNRLCECLKGDRGRQGEVCYFT